MNQIAGVYSEEETALQDSIEGESENELGERNISKSCEKDYMLIVHVLECPRCLLADYYHNNMIQ